MIVHDDEIENYKAKYGSIQPNDKYFDDHPDLGNDYLQYKISNIKFWKRKKGNNNVLAGIQTTYKSISTDEVIISDEYKGNNDDNNNLEAVEFILDPNEYIVNCSLCYNDSSIFKISFKTNLKKEFSVGEKKGEEIQVSEFSQNKKKFVLSFFGTFGNEYLTSIGLFINNSDEFFTYFLKGYFQLKIFLENKDNLKKIEKKLEDKKFYDENIALIKACKLPKILFHQIMKYSNPI